MKTDTISRIMIKAFLFKNGVVAVGENSPEFSDYILDLSDQHESLPTHWTSFDNQEEFQQFQREYESDGIIDMKLGIKEWEHSLTH